MTSRILALVDDLFFAAKISNTACHCGVKVQVLSSLESFKHEIEIGQPALVILDLNGTASRPFEAVRSLKSTPALAGIPVVAFYSHVQTALKEQARQAGCDRILPRSVFSKNLASILTEFSPADGESS
jgi:CheY-like chemotaxis protein